MVAQVNIERVPIDSVRGDKRNVRKHSKRNLEAIKRSLEAFGPQKPIVVDAKGVIVAGNGTLDAALALGWKHIDIVRTNLEGAARKAYAVADNRSAELAEWNEDGLAELLASLQGDETFDETITGFDEREISHLIGLLDVVEDEAPVASETVITRLGELWLLGDHRVLCGDATKADDVRRLMGCDTAGLCFTSPPYAQQRDYGKKIDDWDGLMRGVFGNLLMAADGQVLVNLGLVHKGCEWWSYWDGWIEWMRTQGWRRFGWYVWDQGAGLPGNWDGRLGPSHEFVFHFNRQNMEPDKWVAKKPKSIKLRSFGESSMRKANGTVKRLVTPGASRQPTKVPDSVIRVTRQKGSDGHPAQFPVAFPAFVIRCWDGIIVDPFLGSGTTLIAAEQLGRRCYGIEIEPKYVDVTLKRWMNLTGKSPVRESDGKAFAELLGEIQQ